MATYRIRTRYTTAEIIDYDVEAETQDEARVLWADDLNVGNYPGQHISFSEDQSIMTVTPLADVPPPVAREQLALPLGLGLEAIAP